MMKRVMIALLTLLLLTAPALSEEAKRVYLAGETEPFPEEAELLTLRVCPLLGADCMLLTVGDHSMLIDTGRKGDIDDLNAMLKVAGLSSVEYVLNTHPHLDHAGGVRPLLEEGFGIGAFITFFPHDYTDEGGQIVIQASAIKAVEEAGVPILDLDNGAVLSLGDALLTAYRIPQDRFISNSDCNNRSAMIMIQYGNCSALLAADVENEAQPILADLYDLKADILKYPHHGVVAAHTAFLRDVDPEYVVFTHGSKNTLDAQRHLVRQGYSRMTFASWGLITLQTDGEKWIVSQEIAPSMENYVKNYKIDP